VNLRRGSEASLGTALFAGVAIGACQCVGLPTNTIFACEPDGGCPAGFVCVCDGGLRDGGSTDSGGSDSGSRDSGVADSGRPDAGAPDSGALDSGMADSGSVDSGLVGAGVALQIAAGGLHSCALVAGGTVDCWGDNSSGQLGVSISDASYQLSPVPVSGVSNAVAVVAGSDHTCALIADGTVLCWGGNANGQLGSIVGDAGLSVTPVRVSGLSNAVAITAGEFHTCALLANGTAWCWGWNSSGQLGNLGDGGESQFSPIPVGKLTGILSISAANLSTCALLVGGTVECWGDNTLGELGNGMMNTSVQPVPVSGISSAVSIFGGTHFACAILSDGTARCWGDDGFGQLGNAEYDDAGISTPVLVQGLSQAVAMAPGDSFTCALANNGAAECVGSGFKGRLGNGNGDGGTSLKFVSTGIANAFQLSSRGGHTCAVLSDGTASCWGTNGFGQLGDGTRTDRWSPVPVQGLVGTPLPKSLASGFGAVNACVVMSNGTADCWGNDSYGQLGNGTAIDGGSGPVQVTGLSDVTALSTGNGHACAIQTGSFPLSCWGDNGQGELGNSTTNDESTPVTVGMEAGFQTAKAISSTGFRSSALFADGTTWDWGDGISGQLGDGLKLNSAVPVKTLIADAGVVAIGGGDGHACAVLSGATVQCWGSNQSVPLPGWSSFQPGQLGNGDADAGLFSVPLPVNSLAHAVAVVGGYAHSCALLADGTASCWGDNTYGQLGVGTDAGATATPAAVDGLTNATSLACGYLHTCALVAGGTVACWGNNGFGQLGNKLPSPVSAPTSVVGLSGVVSIAAGAFHTCALTANGTTYCWGFNGDEELGTSTPPFTATPTVVSIP
jgi:alpha-tubulin suppressor-like RCC1 family protein